MTLTFTIPRPASLKNDRRNRVVPGRGIISFKTRETVRCFENIQDVCFAAMLEQLVDFDPGERAPWIPDDNVAVRMIHDVRNELLHVACEPCGPRPPKRVRSGRRCDLSNLADIVLDAMQRLAFQNDNQVTRLVMERVVDPATIGGPIEC